MMSEYYDHYHHWEPLAEFHFRIDENEDLYGENYVYCLCSRAFIRDGVKTYYVEKEDASESDVEVLRESKDCEDQSHVHFSLDTSYKVKCEKDEGASCYCSASHTDNYCSTDEHDPAQFQCASSHGIQPSDSGADLTYQDSHLESTNNDKLGKMDQDISPVTQVSNEDYHSEITWEKFWAINGERLIWASWIEKYSDYINPAYLDENHDLVMDDNNIPKQKSFDQIYNKDQEAESNNIENESMRERKFSYDSKVNPYKGSTNKKSKDEKSDVGDVTKDEGWELIGRRRSCSEHDRMLSPRTLAATDSMTNVTKMTLSSYDVTSSHVTSESSPTEDYSVSSSTSDDPSNDQTRIANIENENLEPSSELDTEHYWQLLWKKHFGEQYAFHCANYIESHDKVDKDIPLINIENVSEIKSDIKAIDIEYDHSLISEIKSEEKATDIECENSDGNSQDMPTMIEVQTHIECENSGGNSQVAPTLIEVQTHIECENSESNSQEMPTIIEVQSKVQVLRIDDKLPKPKKRNKNKSTKYVDSVGFLLSFLREEHKKNNSSELTDTGDGDKDKSNCGTEAVVDVSSSVANTQQSVSNSNFSPCSYNDGDDDPPEDKPISLKRSHEFDEDEEVAEKLKNTFEMMGFSIHPENMPSGIIVYRKRNARLRPPRHKRFGVSRKTYFDDDGNQCSMDQAQDSHDEREMQTDDDCSVPISKSDAQKLSSEESASNFDNKSADLNETEINQTDNAQIIDESDNKHCKDVVLEASAVPLPTDLDASFTDGQENYDSEQKINEDVVPGGPIIKRRRRPKRKVDDHGVNISEVPVELQGEPKMIKYWKKRHSLFHRFDEGIKLDRESWFSVTPENVAWHIANKVVYDVVLDAFCGAGGNTIQFARVCKKVIAIDIDPAKIELAKYNATVYGVVHKIEFIVGDFFELAPKLEADMVFLSPPWGGPNYSENSQYDIEQKLEPKPASELMQVARTINHNIALYLPRNTRSDQILELAKEAGGSVEIEQSYLDKRFVAITAYFY